MRLVSDCLTAASRRVRYEDGFWLRGRLDGPLPSTAIDQPPEIERVFLESAIDRALPTGSCSTLGSGSGIVPEHAYAEDVKLDLTKSVEPLGPTPKLGTAFYLACEEAFGRPGARVEVCFTKLKTPQEEADEAAQAFGDDVAAATDAIIDAAKDVANVIAEVMDAPTALDVDAEGTLQAEFDAVMDARDNLASLEDIAVLRDAVDALANAWDGSSSDAVHPDIRADAITKALTEGNIYAGIMVMISNPVTAPAGFLLWAEWQDRMGDEGEAALDDLRDAIRDSHRVLEHMTSEGLTGYTGAVAVGAVPPGAGRSGGALGVLRRSALARAGHRASRRSGKRAFPT